MICCIFFYFFYLIWWERQLLGLDFIYALLACLLLHLQLALSFAISFSFSANGKRTINFLISLNLLLYFSEKIGEDDPIAARGGHLFFERIDAGHFLVMLLQNLLYIVFHFLRLLQSRLHLHLLDSLLRLAQPLHLWAQLANQLSKHALDLTKSTFFLVYYCICDMQSPNYPRILSIPLAYLLSDRPFSLNKTWEGWFTDGTDGRLRSNSESPFDWIARFLRVCFPLCFWLGLRRMNLGESRFYFDIGTIDFIILWKNLTLSPSTNQLQSEKGKQWQYKSKET